MDDTPSQRRLAENEVMFRQYNERVQKGVADTNCIALEDNQPEYIISVDPRDAPLRFFCECSDENCNIRIQINIHDYAEIHKQRDRFMVRPGHDVPEIEHIVLKLEPDYHVVKKHMVPPETAKNLNPTNVNNC